MPFLSVSSVPDPGPGTLQGNGKCLLLLLAGEPELLLGEGVPHPHTAPPRQLARLAWGASEALPPEILAKLILDGV